MPNLADAKLYLGATQIGGADDAVWVRNPAWPAFPAITDTDEKFIGLKAVFDHGSNFLALTCRGAYTVDWGDGSAPEDVADNVQAQHLYDFASASLYSHADLPYKIATVTATPQTSQNLTTLSIHKRHSSTAYAYESGWLDIALSLPNCTTTGMELSTTTEVVRKRMCERVRVLNFGATSTLEREFTNFASLQEISLPAMTSVTNAVGMIVGCRQLRKMEPLNLPALTSIGSFAQDCTALRELEITAPNVSDINNLCRDCTTLRRVKLTTASITVANSAFTGCRELRDLEVTFGTVTNMASCFAWTQFLTELPMMNTSALTSWNEMVWNSNVIEVPAYNFSGMTTLATSTFATNTSSIARIKVTGISVDFTVTNLNLGPAALNEIFTNLADRTSLASRTIIVTGNWGIGQGVYDATIATDKNWVVTE
jgi:hypothetical protein